MQPHIEILSDRAAITKRALEIVTASYEQAIKTFDKFSFVAAGGNTPRALYEALSSQSFDWQKVHIFWGDERYVPVSDPQSNFGMTRQAWLDKVSIPVTNIHPMPTDANDPQLDAKSYENQLWEFFGMDNYEQFPQFDLILLGIGDDGHTASLFPHTEALKVSDRLITVGQKDDQPRITFTAPLINQAKQILFLVEGANKSKALSAIFSSVEDDHTYPARLIQGNVTWLIAQNSQSNQNTVSQ